MTTTTTAATTTTSTISCTVCGRKHGERIDNVVSGLNCADCFALKLNSRWRTLSRLEIENDELRKSYSPPSKAHFMKETQQALLHEFMNNEISSFEAKNNKLKQELNVILQQIQGLQLNLQKRKTQRESIPSSALSSFSQRVQNLKMVVSGLDQVAGDQSLVLKRRNLINRLAVLYPVTSPASSKEMGTIAGFPIPSTPEEALKLNPDICLASLSLVARSVLFASSVLSLPLPYKMKVMGRIVYISKSSEQVNELVPSTSSGFALGLFQLNQNILSLCLRQGLPENLLGDQIHNNLWQLFHSPLLGHSAVFDDGTRTSSILFTVTPNTDPTLSTHDSFSESSSNSKNHKPTKYQTNKTTMENDQDEFVLL